MTFLSNNKVINLNFINQTKRLLRDEYDAFEAALQEASPVSIRFNPRKSPIPPLKGNGVTPPLKGAGGCYGGCYGGCQIQIPWCATGYYLPERPYFTGDPLFHAGAYYVQEASSMFLEQAVLTLLAQPDFPQKGIVALDLCAAPGGKSTHLLALLPDDSLLVSNEVIRSRCLILSENMTKWGYANTIITQNDPKDFGQLSHLFDVIVADLPCSGEGMFRKDPSASKAWNIEQVQHNAARQRRIIRDAWNALKPGGYLIYSTCTFNTEENEDNVKMLADELGADILPVPVKKEWNISGALSHSIPVCRFFPHRTRGEGFFLALLRKKVTTSSLPLIHRNLLANPEKFIFQNTGQLFSAIPANHERLFTTLSGHLNIVSAGLILGESKGAAFIPSAALSLSTELNANAFPTVELDDKQAITYLQKDTLFLSGNSPKGYNLVTFNNTPIGFVKNIGYRANNLYPQEWRIRKKSGL